MTFPPRADLATAGQARVVDQYGGPLPLSDLWVEGPALLMLVPAAFSTHCTSEVTALEARSARLRAAGVQPAVLSCDPVGALRAWGEQLGVSFPLLSDFWPHGLVATALGAFDGGLGVATRLSLLVEDGRIRWSVHGDLGSARDLDAHLDALDILRS